MPAHDDLSPFALVGLSTQIAGAALNSLLFLLLQRHAVRHRPFKLWCAGWLLLTVSLLALLPWVRAAGAASAVSFLPRFGLSTYQVAKLGFLVLLLTGLLAFTHGIRWRRWLGAGLPAAAVGGAASLLISEGLNGALALQSPVAVAVTAYGSLLLLRLPALRRSLGTRVTGAALALLALLWCCNIVTLWRPSAGYGIRVIDSVARLASDFGAFGDVVLQILPGLGMVVILFEGIMRETAAAHEQLTVSHRHLERQAYIDTLTGAYNRAAFAAGRGLGLAASTFGVAVMFDLDDLKAVNDDHGHATGDALLRTFAETVRGLLRSSDPVYRWGGDEFVAILPGAALAETAARLTEGLDRSPGFRLGDGRVIPLRASLGMAAFSSGADLEAAIAAADGRMLAEKRRRQTTTRRSGR